ncbi:MAG: hypothetical protein LC624_01630 [Halobacteriales archaeon]|nr:hypothetical protein [Halobacteriales archaeon]
MTRLLVMVLAALCAGSPAVATTILQGDGVPVQTVASTAGPVAGGPPMVKAWLELDLNAIASEVAQDGQVSLALPTGSAHLLVHEFDIFLPGERKYGALAADGSVLWEKPYTGRFFTGTVKETGEPAFVALTDTGLYGGVYFHGLLFSIDPRPGPTPGVWRHEASWTPLIRLIPQPGPSPEIVHYEYWIMPRAEQSFVNYAADWQNRMSTAYAYFNAVNMWEGETQTRVKTYTIFSLNQDFASVNNCGGSDIGLQNFRLNWVQGHLQNGPNAYNIWHAYDDGGNQIGCAYISCVANYGCLQNANPGSYTQNEWADVAVQARDWSQVDAYDPGNVVHRALILNQEITHNAGEPLHPTDGNACLDNNVMNNDVSINCRDFWRVASSISKVGFYGEPRFKHV